MQHNGQVAPMLELDEARISSIPYANKACHWVRVIRRVILHFVFGAFLGNAADLAGIT
jgi:hypothetical protein